MAGRDPVLVVGLGAGGDGRSVDAGGRGDALVCCALFGGAAGGALLLGEVGNDPDGVEEVDDADEAGEDEEVEEDAGVVLVGGCLWLDGRGRFVEAVGGEKGVMEGELGPIYSHLRVED